MGIKDSVVSSAVKTWLNSNYEEYAKMLNFNLDSDEKTIDMDILLRGEEEPIHINIGHYELTQDSGEYYISVDSITASREWIEVFANNLIAGKMFKVPSNYANMISMLI